jgi:curved DNA-binding protein CbpA
MFVDYYTLLDIPYDSSLSDIKIAYRKQAMKWHPDRNSQDTSYRMQLINEAKLILLDEEAREKYDIEYLKFTQYHKNKDYQEAELKDETKHDTKESYSYEYKEYNIHDDVLDSWIQNARQQAKEIIKETIEISSVGGRAALQEIKSVFIFLIVGFIISIMIFIILTLY